MQRKHGVILTLISCLALLGVSPVAANADPLTQSPEWTKPLPDIAPRNLEVSADGTVMGSTCDYSTNAVIGLDPSDGATITDMPSSYDGTIRCVIEQAVGHDDTVYVIESENMDGRYGTYATAFVAAYKDDVRLWKRDFGSCQAQSNWWPYGMIETEIVPQSLEVGHDGGIYLIATANGACEPYLKDKLVKLDKKTGDVRYTVPLNTVGTDGAWLANRLTAYEQGLVVADAQVLRYMNYDGTDQGDRSMVYNEGVINHIVAPDGHAFMTPIWNGNIPCGSITHNPGTDTGSPNTFTLDECFGDVVNMKQVPGGKFALEYYDGPQQQGNYNVKLYNSDGTSEYERILTPNGESGSPYSTRMSYDSAGNAMITQIESNGKLSFEVMDGDGVTTASFEAAGISVSANKLGPVAISDGVAYVVICNASCWYNQSAQGSVLYKFAIPEIGDSYPRGHLVNTDPSFKQYVAMGDSYSSGEGNGSFYAGTDVADVNKCHRSTNAYGPLIANHVPSENLGLVDFTACSGATTEDVLGLPDPVDPNDKGGIWNEPAQVDALSEQTDVVTISIGGNDVSFGGYAEQCILVDCDVNTTAYYDIVHALEFDLHAKLYNLYQQILEKAPNAKVYVVGYSQLAPNPDVVSIPAQCVYFHSSTHGSGADARAARNVVTKLNEVIDFAVTSAESVKSTYQGRISFIDPNENTTVNFSQHDVCQGGNSYFHNVIPDDADIYKEKIFHPNVAGHEAYAVAVVEGMS